MPDGCAQENCTVATTGVCLLNFDPITNCSSFNKDFEETDTLEEELLPEPEQNVPFSYSGVLTADTVSSLTGSRYCTLVGIVGPPDAGKTAVLVSLYLLLSHGRLESFQFADSRSLMALDEISRGARRWTGGAPPDQMTAHTELSNDRAAGFLHLRLRMTHSAGLVDFLLPDLPGEWSTALVEESRHDRFAFLSRADVIWLMVDGRQLASPDTRHAALHRTKLYLQRLREFFPKLPRIILVVSRADCGTIRNGDKQEILEEAEILQIDFSIKAISSFSQNPEVEAGTGIFELITASIGKKPEKIEFWPNSNTNIGVRAFESLFLGGVDL